MGKEQVIRSSFVVPEEEAPLCLEAASLVGDAVVGVRSHEQTVSDRDTEPAPEGQVRVSLVNRTTEGYQEFRSKLAELMIDAV